MADALQTSFSQGEISPSLRGRADLDLYYRGLALANNVVITVFGGVKHRPGLSRLETEAATANSLTIIPFALNNFDSGLWNFTNDGVGSIAAYNARQQGTDDFFLSFETGILDNQRVNYVQGGNEVLIVGRNFDPLQLRRNSNGEIERIPYSNDTLSAIDDFGQPGAVAYHKQRLVFAGSLRYPGGVLMSKVGDSTTFTAGTPIAPDDAIFAILRSKTVDLITQMAELENLILFTEGGEWRLHGENDILTPSTVDFQRLSSWGCSDVPVVAVQDALLFVPPERKAIRIFRQSGGQAQSEDLTLLSRHLFEESPIKQVAYANRLLAVVFDNGKAAFCTLDTQQRVSAWTRLTTNLGPIQYVEAIPVNGVQTLFFVLNDNLMRLDPDFGYDAVQRLTSRDLDEGYVDFPALSGYTGLLGIYSADGIRKILVQPELIDSIPRVHLPEKIAISEADIFGVPFDVAFETLNVSSVSGRGQLNGRRVKLGPVRILAHDTSNILVGPEAGKMVQLTGKLDSEGWTKVSIPPVWKSSGRIRIESNDPHDLEILAIAPELNIGDN